ncbi:MAG: hypothetical protein HKM89_05745 [Gemmatimonadales bacterium]|nr:hypothetical protein [Gemmatimonadales bacterium]
MPDHAIFGGVLRSEIHFPDLRPAGGGGGGAHPTWSFHRSPEAPPPDAGEFLGEVAFDAGSHLRVSKTPRGLRFVYTDTGVFDVSADGRDIVWFPTPDADLDLALIDVAGRVMAGALHLSGLLCLHGSAVALTHGGIAFLAPKHYGKSTLALAMTRGGAKLLTDDTLPVELGHPIQLWPGVHSVRLWADSAERLAPDRIGTSREYGGKHVLDELSKDALANHVAPLSAVYILSPPPQTPSGPATRSRLADVPAAMALVQHTKIGALLGKSEAPALFERAVAVARDVPVYSLEYERDFAHVDHLVQQLLEWHSRPPGPTA